MAREPLMFVTYSDSSRVRHEGWFVFLTKATVASGHPDAGRSFWRYALSRHENQTDLHALWRDKNPRGRSFATRRFASRDEAKGAAIANIPL